MSIRGQSLDSSHSGHMSLRRKRSFEKARVSPEHATATGNEALSGQRGGVQTRFGPFAASSPPPQNPRRAYFGKYRDKKLRAVTLRKPSPATLAAPNTRRMGRFSSSWPSSGCTSSRVTVGVSRISGEHLRSSMMALSFLDRRLRCGQWAQNCPPQLVAHREKVQNEARRRLVGVYLGNGGAEA